MRRKMGEKIGLVKGTGTNVDTVIMNGKVITVDKNFSIKESIAVRDGWIVFVGTNEHVKKFIGKQTKVLDLKDKSILPGINDSHGHAALYGGTRPPLALDLSSPTVKSIRDIVASLGAKVRTMHPGEWVRGFGWNPSFLEECQIDTKRYPTRWDIDAISPNHPVVFNDFSGHNLWVNSKALELSGISKDTPDPPGGIIVRAPETGEPTGIFREPSAQGLVMKVVPLLTKEEKRAAIRSAMQVMNANGITSCTESALGSGGNQLMGGLLGEDCIDVYRDLSCEGRLTARVSILMLFGQYGGLSFSDLKEGLKNYTWPVDLDSKWLRSAGIKIFADGVPISKTSWMRQEYVGGGYGSLTVPGATDEDKYSQLKEMILYCHKKGFQIGVHATGDRAISATIDGFAEAIKGNPRMRSRHYIIHGDFITPQDVERAAKHRIGINMQPYIQSLIADAEPLIVGAQRAAYEWPFRTVLDGGVPLSFSSDMPVTYPNWRQGVQSAVLREAVGSGKVSGPEERLTVEEAIRAYTIQGAWQDSMEKLKGSIEKGKLADFCVLGEDILAIEPHKIKDIPVLMTIINGEIVYDADAMGDAIK
jgi:predicted amidohydrolase YtcJ